MSDSANRKPQIEPKVDATGARQGFNEIKEAARDMATSVEQAGKKAGAGLEGVGDGAPKAAEKLDRATKSIIGSIERTTASMQAGERGTAKYFETLANQRGVNTEALKPYLDQLRQAEAAQKLASGSLDKMGISAAQTAAALRGVPAQFTDIVTALQGGQQPLTVFLQQGGQLKDMFGGAGNAARALGGYVAGLINPFTVAAAAVVGLGIAYAKGSAEQQEFQKTLILTGNQAGVTASQLMDMAAAVRASGSGTQGRAAEVINLMAADSKIGAENMRRFTAAILEMERAGGPAAEELVKQFASLGKTPLESALKLNETTGFLTRSVYEQIRALEDAGKTTEAAKVAQDAYAKAIEERSPELVKNLGLIERAWLSIKDAGKGALDDILKIGRKDTLSDLSMQLKDAERQLAQAGQGGFYAVYLEKKVDALRQQVVAAREVANWEARGAAAEAEGNRQLEARAKWDKDGLAFLSKREQMEREIAKAITEAAEAKATQAELNSRLASIRDKYDDKGAKSEIDSIKAKIAETQKYIDLLRTGRVEEAKQTEGEKLVAQLQEQLRGRMDGITRGYKEQALAQAQKLVAVEKDSQETEKLYKYVSQATDAYRKQIAETIKAAEAVELQAQKQDAANKVFGETKTAIEEMVLAQKKAERTKFLEGEFIDPAQLAAIDRAIKAQQHLVDSLKTADFLAIDRQMNEWVRSAKELDDLYASELQLAGLTTLERNKILAARQVELKLAKALADIDKSGLSDDQKAIERDKARQAAQIESNAAVNKVVRDEWNKTSDQIAQSLTDALMRGFESGKGFAQNLRDTVSNMFRTLVLRPVVQAVVQPLAGAITGGLGLASTAANAGSLYGASSGLYGLMAGNSFIGNSASVAAGIYGGMGELSSLGLGEALSSGWGALMGGQVSGGLATLTGALGPLVAGVAAIAAIAKSLDNSGTVHTGASSAYSSITGLSTGAGLYGVGSKAGAYSTQTEALTSQIAQSVVGLLDSTATAFGKQAGFQAAAAFADDTSKDGAWGALAIKLGDQIVAGFGVEGNGKWPGKGFADGQAGLDQYLAAVSGDVRKALDAVGLPSWATSMLDKLGAAPSLEQLTQTVAQINEIQAALGAMGKAMPQVAGLTDAAVQTLITAFGGIQGLGQSLGTYYENFYSEAERNARATDEVTKALAGLGLTMPTTREAFRALVEAQDLTTEAGQAAYAQLLKLAPTFAALVPVTQEVGKAVDDTAAAMQKAAEAMAEAGRRSLETLADEKGGLLVDLLKAQGDAVGAAALARQQDLAKRLAGVSDTDKAAILAAYDYNQALRDQIAALQAASTAADQAAASQRQAEADAKAKADAITAQAYGLTTQILQLEGDTAELRRRELEQLDPANRALQERIYALQDQKAAESAAAQAADAIARAQAQAASDSQRAAEEQQRAAEQFRQAWQSVGDSLIDEARRIRGLITGGSALSFANAQTQFAITSAQARAGDQEAAKLLPGLSQTLLTLAEAQATSLFELQRIRAQTAASLEGTAGVLGGLFGLSIPRLATGTNEVPADMLAILHKGEAVVPAAYNPISGGSNAELVAEIRALREEAKVRDLRIVQLTVEMNKRFKEWDASGLPHERVEA